MVVVVVIVYVVGIVVVVIVVIIVVIVIVPFGILGVHIPIVVVRVAIGIAIVIVGVGVIVIAVYVRVGALILALGHDGGNAEGADQGNAFGHALHGLAPGELLVHAGVGGTGSILIPFVIHCLSPQESTPTRCGDGTMDLIDPIFYCSGTIGEKPTVSYQYCRNYTRDGAAVSRAFGGRGGHGILSVDKKEMILLLYGRAVCDTGDAGRPRFFRAYQ
jgi:hypothetical protein